MDIGLLVIYTSREPWIQAFRFVPKRQPARPQLVYRCGRNGSFKEFFSRIALLKPGRYVSVAHLNPVTRGEGQTFNTARSYSVASELDVRCICVCLPRDTCI